MIRLCVVFGFAYCVRFSDAYLRRGPRRAVFAPDFAAEAAPRLLTPSFRSPSVRTSVVSHATPATPVRLETGSGGAANTGNQGEPAGDYLDGPQDGAAGGTTSTTGTHYLDVPHYPVDNRSLLIMRDDRLSNGDLLVIALAGMMRGTIAFALVVKATPAGAVENGKLLQSTVLFLVLINCTVIGVVFPAVLEVLKGGAGGPQGRQAGGSQCPAALSAGNLSDALLADAAAEGAAAEGAAAAEGGGSARSLSGKATVVSVSDSAVRPVLLRTPRPLCSASAVNRASPPSGSASASTLDRGYSSPGPPPGPRSSRSAALSTESDFFGGGDSSRITSVRQGLGDDPGATDSASLCGAGATIGGELAHASSSSLLDGDLKRVHRWWRRVDERWLKPLLGGRPRAA